MVYNPLAQTCLFGSGWRADRGGAGDRRRLQSEDESVAVCAASAADAAAKHEQLQTELRGLRAETQELKVETRELKALLRQLVDSKQAA